VQDRLAAPQWPYRPGRRGCEREQGQARREEGREQSARARARGQAAGLTGRSELLPVLAWTWSGRVTRRGEAEPGSLLLLLVHPLCRLPTRRAQPWGCTAPSVLFSSRCGSCAHPDSPSSSTSRPHHSSAPLAFCATDTALVAARRAPGPYTVHRVPARPLHVDAGRAYRPHSPAHLLHPLRAGLSAGRGLPNLALPAQGWAIGLRF